MTQKFFKLIVLVSYILPMQIYAEISFDLADINDEINIVRKPFNSLQVAGPLAVTGLASLAALNVKNGADFGSDVAVDGTLFVDGGIVLDSCLVLTCTSAGTLLVNGVPITAGGGGGSCDLPSVVDALAGLSNAIDEGFIGTFTVINALGACGAMPFTVPAGGTYNVTAPGYYCLAGDTTGNIVINSGVSDVTLDLNNHTISPATGVTGIAVQQTNSRITIKNGTIVSNATAVGIDLQGVGGDSDFHIYDVNIDGASNGIQAATIGLTNLDIARVIVTSSGLGFYIGTSSGGPSNFTLSACQASGCETGFEITGAASPGYALLNSCVAGDNTNGGFYIAGSNVVLTHCIAQGGGQTGDGFSLDESVNNSMLAYCTANFNNDGFRNGAKGVCSFISCIAENNYSDGFNMISSTQASPQGSGLIMSCIAEGNGVSNNACGFDDAFGPGGPGTPSLSLYQYVNNCAQGNGTTPAQGVPNFDSNYCLGGGSGQTNPNGTVAPFYQSPPNFYGDLEAFTPAYWNNITLAGIPVV